MLYGEKNRLVALSERRRAYRSVANSLPPLATAFTSSVISIGAGSTDQAGRVKTRTKMAANFLQFIRRSLRYGIFACRSWRHLIRCEGSRRLAFATRSHG